MSNNENVTQINFLAEMYFLYFHTQYNWLQSTLLVIDVIQKSNFLRAGGLQLHPVQIQEGEIQMQIQTIQIQIPTEKNTRIYKTYK